MTNTARRKAFTSWALDSVDRAIRYAAIAAIPAAAMGSDAIDIVSVNVNGALKMAAGAALLSLLRSITHMPSLATGEVDKSDNDDGTTDSSQKVA